MMTRAHDITHDELAALIGKPDPLILEIGANDGADTLELLTRFPRPRIHCFECDPRAIDKWMARLGADPRATLYRFALDEEKGKRTFHQSSGKPRRDYQGEWDMSGSLCQPTGHLGYSPWCKFETTIDVECETLDAWAEAAIPAGKVIDFIWIDVQGAEGRVFRAGRATLARTRLLKVECHDGEMYAGQPNQAELDALLAGWTCLGRYGDDLVYRNGDIR